MKEYKSIKKCQERKKKQITKEAIMKKMKAKQNHLKNIKINCKEK